MVVKLKRITLVMSLILSMCGLLSLAGDDAPTPIAAKAPAVVTTASTASTTTTTVAPAPTTVPRVVRASRSLQGGVRRPVVGGDIWRALANCESALGNDSRSGKYHGYFQFSLATWQSVGGTGDPHTYSYEEQLHFAQILQARSGWGQWPVCSRKLGLR